METKQSELLSELNSSFARNLLPVTIFVGIEAVIGFLANIFVLYMFVRHHESSNYRTFVLFLALIDFVCTVTTMPGEIVSHRLWYRYPSKTICKTKDFFNIVTVSAETFCLLLIAIERKGLVKSDQSRRIDRRQAILYCLFAYLIAALLAYPVTLFWGLRSFAKTFNGTLVNVTICEKDQLYADTSLPELYEICVGIILVILLVITIAQYAIIAKVIRSDDAPMDSETASVILRQTKLFLCITGMFFLTTVLYFTMISILGSSENIVNSLSYARKTTFFFFLRFYFIQHVVNPFIYGLSDEQVRYRIKAYTCLTCRTADEYQSIN